MHLLQKLLKQTHHKQWWILPSAISLIQKVNQKRQYTGLFKFGDKYINQVKLFTKTKEITLQRVFSPPSDLDLNVNVIEDKSIKNYQVKKDNCFENYFLELLI